MEFDRQTDGDLQPLKQKGIDTGMGFDRLCMISQNKDSVYNTDLFEPIQKKIEELTGLLYDKQKPDIKAAFHVVEDHVRSSTFLIADGCIPSNEGRGYVLRKIIRRAALFVQRLTDKDIFPQLARVVIEEMSDIYPELSVSEDLIVTTLRSEIQRFAINLVRGKKILEDYLQKHPDHISGLQAFKLYDTFGFPLELLIAVARERGITVDIEGFDAAMREQQERSGKKMTVDELDQLAIAEELSTTFTGYDTYEIETKIIGLIKDNKLVQSVKAGEICWVITKESPFFVIGGGQVPDSGWITIKDKKVALLDVRYVGNGIAAQITAPVSLKVGDAVIETVDEPFRKDVMRNHTATHLLQAALIELFGMRIKQAGSFVSPDYLRFDFSYTGSLSQEDIKKVEDLVNQKIRDNVELCIEYMTLEQATKRGALAFFGEKYTPEQVRVVEVPGFSAELCCGTHVRATGDIGVFKITEEKALAAGQRRMTAVTGRAAVELFQHDFNTIKVLSNEFKVQHEAVLDAISVQKEQFQQMQKELKQMRLQLLDAQLPLWEKQIEEIKGIPTLFLELKDRAHDELKEIAQRLEKKKPGLYILISSVDDRTLFFASLSKSFAKNLSLKDVADWLGKEFGIRGGGSPVMIQGGGGKLDKKLGDALFAWLKKNIS